MKPNVVVWYQVYAGVMTALYALIVLAGLFLIFADPATLDAPPDEVEAMRIGGVVYIVMGLFFGAAFLASIFLPRAMWAWIVQLILICLGLLSCCLWPAVIPLLIFYCKQETRDWFTNAPSE